MFNILLLRRKKIGQNKFGGRWSLNLEMAQGIRLMSYEWIESSDRKISISRIKWSSGRHRRCDSIYQQGNALEWVTDQEPKSKNGHLLSHTRNGERTTTFLDRFVPNLIKKTLGNTNICQEYQKSKTLWRNSERDPRKPESLIRSPNRRKMRKLDKNSRMRGTVPRRRSTRRRGGTRPPRGRPCPPLGPRSPGTRRGCKSPAPPGTPSEA